MTRYRLSRYVYPAVLGPQVVFFDIRTKAFISLRTHWVYRLRNMVEDWRMPPLLETPGEEDIDSAAASAFAAQLAERQLLTTSSEGKAMEQLQIEEVCEVCVDPAAVPKAGTTVRDALQILSSAISATRNFYRKPFEELTCQLSGRRALHHSQRHHAVRGRVGSLLTSYWHMRPLLPLDRFCDFTDSLTVIEYLARRGFFPRLVIGVQLMPFATHAWVQDGAMVLNDTPEFVRQFTPVFAT